MTSDNQLAELMAALRGNLMAEAIPILERAIRTYGNLRVCEANVERLTKEIGQ